ncbi:four-carbon acid sugar kinase family protein [Agromyces aerolatus]|uniref:four-carbon acid sugar kinase family protein n=1 Tax=Agromyces sp. LY-1074 TaxID=3074080 RepID=UPI00285C0346|nr:MULTISPECIES: four-carbon acid sugar kinase family protein [unclassified Agromyces]MDR5701398.1 four-carbon acid sugar kinase family protein [Agromyces sp. LY-1074]MDR5706813.1 four-carbon acid sugar kinase family protein [Agromyces sp. LY-1358]
MSDAIGPTRPAGAVPAAIGVLAEDLQGALAAASRLQQRGLRVALVQSRGDLVPEVDAIIVDLGLRHRLEEPGQVTAEWTRWLRAHGADRIEARLDPALHGNPGAILRGARDAVPTDALAWIVPAYPTAGRACLDGKLLLTAPDGTATELDLREQLGLGEDAVGIDLHTVTAGAEAVHEAVATAREAGARTFVFDSTTESHLEVLAEASARVRADGAELITATSGAWLRYHPDTGRDGYLIVAASGSNLVDRAQLLRVSNTYGPKALVMSAEEVIGASHEHVQRVVDQHRVVVVQAHDVTRADPAVVAGEIGRAVRRVLDLGSTGLRPCLGIVTSGGLTTSEVIRGLEPVSLRPGNELEPLCPVVRVAGGPFDHLPVISKSGGVGTPETLVRLIRRILGT